MTLQRFDVVPNGGQWAVRTGSQTVSTHPRKTEAVQDGRRVAQSAQPASLRIHGRNGQFQEERTYPRSADPRSSKG